MEGADETTFIFKLIENVERKNCLYEKTDPFYYNKIVKEKSWVEVAETCTKNATECKHRWKLLRERFCKELKKLEAPSGSGMCYLQEWTFFQSLMFLKGSLAPRRTRDNVEDSDSLILEESLSEDVVADCTETPTPRKKPKTTIESLCRRFGETIDNIEKNLSNEETADNAFGKTIVLLMMDLPQEAKDDFQASVMQELYRLRKAFRNNNSKILKNI